MTADPRPETSPAGTRPADIREAGTIDRPGTEAVAAPATRRSNSFFRRQRTPLPRDDAQRQGDISQLAFLTMGGRDAAIAFLNSENAELGGRPLAVATASAEGFEQVATAIRASTPAADAASGAGSARAPGFE